MNLEDLKQLVRGRIDQAVESLTGALNLFSGRKLNQPDQYSIWTSKMIARIEPYPSSDKI